MCLKKRFTQGGTLKFFYSSLVRSGSVHSPSFPFLFLLPPGFPNSGRSRPNPPAHG